MDSATQDLFDGLRSISPNERVRERVHSIVNGWRNRVGDQKSLSGLTFEGLLLDGADFSHCDLTGSHFVNCRLGSAVFHHARLQGARFISSDAETKGACTDCDFNNANCQNATFQDLNLLNGKWIRTELDGAVFRRVALRNCDFNGAVLNRTVFDDVEADTTTRFPRLTSCKGMQIDRYAFACLGPECGSLTLGNQMDMTIVDHVAELRSQFGGLWGRLHLAALAVFLLPYVWFLGRQALAARFHREATAENSISIFTAFWWYVLRGGVNWQKGWPDDLWRFNWWPPVMFALFLLYNIVRLVLYAKTKLLETRQEVSGLPAKFSLSERVFPGLVDVRGLRWVRWSTLLNFAKRMIYIAGFSVAYNTWHFLQMRVPLQE